MGVFGDSFNFGFARGMFNGMFGGGFGMPFCYNYFDFRPNFYTPNLNFSIFTPYQNPGGYMPMPTYNQYSPPKFSLPAYSSSSSKSVSTNTTSTTPKTSSATLSNTGERLKLSDAELKRYGFDTPSKVDAFNHLTPKMQRELVDLTKYAESQGIKITYGSKISIFRSYEEQARLYRQKGSRGAAKPGSSLHESGKAVDITIVGANSHDKNDPQYKKLAAYWENKGYRWGGRWGYPGCRTKCEPWHFDLG